MASHGHQVVRGWLWHRSEGSVWKKQVVAAYCGWVHSVARHSAQLKVFKTWEEIIKGQKPKGIIALVSATCQHDTITLSTSPDVHPLGPQGFTSHAFCITTPNGMHEFCAESESNCLRWVRLLRILVMFPYSTIPEELQSNPLEESFRCKLDPAQYGADSAWPVYIFPEEVGTRCAIIGTKVLTFQSGVPNRTVGKLSIFSPADPSNPLVSWEHHKLRRRGRIMGNVVFIEIGRQCQGGPGLVWMWLDALTIWEVVALLRNLFRGDGSAVAIPAQPTNPIYDIPRASDYPCLPPSYHRQASISSGYRHYKLNTMDSNQDPQNVVSPTLTGSSEPPPVCLDQHPSIHRKHLTTCDMPGCNGSCCLHSSSPDENADQGTSKPSMQSADSLINQETLFKQEDSSPQSLSLEESFCAAAMAKQYPPEVMYTNATQNTDEVTLEPGQVVEILEEEMEEGQLKGRVHGKVGLLPSKHVEVVQENGKSSSVPICMSDTPPPEEKQEIKLVDLEHELSETNSWMHLGLYLGLPKHKLDEIHADYGTQGLGRCKLEMLDSVLDWREDTLSWDAVVEAVSKTGNNRIAKKIADKHGIQFTAPVGGVPPLPEELDVELQVLKEKVQAISKKLESGETQFEACSKRKLQLEGDFVEAQQKYEFTQKYTSMLVEDKRIFQRKLEQREDQIAHLQSKQLEYERTIRGLEVQLAGASAELETQQKLKDKLKRLKEQKQNLVDHIESNRREIDRLCEKKAELKLKLDKSAKGISDAESRLKLKNDELFQAKNELKHLKEENGKLLEQLKKQEKDTDVAIVSHDMSQPNMEWCSPYENLKVSTWVEEMEEMSKAVLEKDAYIRKLERDNAYINTSKVGLRAEIEGMTKAMLEKDACIQELGIEGKYINTSKVGLRAEMEGMEEEIQKLKGKEQDQCKGPLPKLSITAFGGSKMYHHPEEDMLEVPERWTQRDIQLQTNLPTGLSQETDPPPPPLPAKQRRCQPAVSTSTVTATTAGVTTPPKPLNLPNHSRMSQETDPPPPPLPAKQRRSQPAHAISTSTVTTATASVTNYDINEQLQGIEGNEDDPDETLYATYAMLHTYRIEADYQRISEEIWKRGRKPPPPLPPCDPGV